MFRYIIFIILAFLAAVIEVSFLPNFRIFGGIINLPFLVLALNFYLSNSSRKGRRTILLAFMLGLFLDLLSGGIFLSATLSLIALALLLEFSNRLVSFEDQNPFSAILVFAGTLLFDLFYISLNHISALNSAVVLPLIFDSLLTAIAYLVAVAVFRHFQPQHHRIPEIRLN